MAVPVPQKAVGENPTAFTLQEAAQVICSEFYKGGCYGDYKAPYGKAQPVDWSTAKKRYKHIVGRLAPGIVMVDFDDMEPFKKRLEIAQRLGQNCIAIESRRGGHFYWSINERFSTKDNQHTKTFLTFYPVDHKHGRSEKKSYTALSLESGEDRRVVYAKFDPFGGLDIMPFYDAPCWISKAKRREDGTVPDIPDTPNFLNMADGDGRNSDLFSHMIPCKRRGLSYEEFQTVAEIINNYLFLNPLDRAEFEKCTRREAWEPIKTDFDTCDSDDAQQRGPSLEEKNTQRIVTGGMIPVELYAVINRKGKVTDYSLDRFSKAFTTYYRAVKINGQPHFYLNGIYTPRISDFEKAFISELSANFDLTEGNRREIYKYVALCAPEIEAAPPQLIAFNNIVLNVITGERLDFSPDMVLTNRIPWDYDAAAVCPLVDSFLNAVSCGDSSVRALLEECAGVCLYRDNRPFKMAFILYGDKHNGKSTYLDLLAAMLGDENISGLDFKQIDERFSTAEIYGKLANIGDDISGAYKEETGTFKIVASGGLLKAEVKYQNPFIFRPYAKLIFAANVKPRMKDETGAALDRLTIIPLSAHFIRGQPDYDPHMREKIIQPEAVKYFIRLALNGLRRVLDSGGFTKSTAADAEKDDYQRINNPVIDFLDQYDAEGISGFRTSDIYNRYQEYCTESGHRAPMTRKAFTKAVCLAKGLITVRKWVSSGKRDYYYSYPDDDLI